MARSHHSDPFATDWLATTIAEYDFAVTHVGYGSCSVPGCCGPAELVPWSYTVGLTTAGRCELVVLGLDLETAHCVLNDVGELFVDGAALPVDQPFDIAGVPVKLLDVPDEWALTDTDRMGCWFRYRETQPTWSPLPQVRQVVWAAAADGRFPDDASGTAASAKAQPVLRDDPFSLPLPVPRVTKRTGRHRKVA